MPMEMSQEQMRGMGMMMDPQQLSKQEPFDEAFIDAMIPHHQSAIYMAQVAQEEAKSAIKELAENIVDAQKLEIEQMKQWRKTGTHKARWPEGLPNVTDHATGRSTDRGVLRRR